MIDLITTATSKDEAERNASVALFPVGSFAQHGDYLPLATDTIVACVVARDLARLAGSLKQPAARDARLHDTIGATRRAPCAHRLNPPEAPRSAT